MPIQDEKPRELRSMKKQTVLKGGAQPKWLSCVAHPTSHLAKLKFVALRGLSLVA